MIARALTQFAGADRADCLFYDADSGSLWSEGTGGAAFAYTLQAGTCNAW